MDFEDLNEEQRAKISGKTPEEILALAKEEGYELSEDELESVAGGRFFRFHAEDSCTWTN